MHADDKTIKPQRKQLRESADSDGYGPVFSSYMRRITKDSTGRFDLFMDIYRSNLQKQIEVSTEEDRKLLEFALGGAARSLEDPLDARDREARLSSGAAAGRLRGPYPGEPVEEAQCGGSGAIAVKDRGRRRAVLCGKDAAIREKYRRTNSESARRPFR